MTYSLKVCVETEELFLVLVKQQLHELLVDRLQLLVGVQRGEQILAIRKTGRTNMFDVPMAQYIANEMRFYELVVFLEEHRGEYVHFILTGEPL